MTISSPPVCRPEIGLWQELLTEPTSKECLSPALFLDRDGVLNQDTGYVGSLDGLKVLENVVPLIHAANMRGSPVIVVTNQSGIGRGYYDWTEFDAINRHIVHTLAAAGARIDAIFACGYHSAGLEEFALPNHPWRKPNPGMLLAAASLLPIDLSASVVVGDRMTDILAGCAAGLRKGILITDSVDVEVPNTFHLCLKPFETAYDETHLALLD